MATYDQKRRSVDGDAEAETDYVERTRLASGRRRSQKWENRSAAEGVHYSLIPRARMNWVMLTDWHCNATPPSMKMPPTKMPFFRPNMSLITGAMGRARKEPMFWTDVMMPGKAKSEQH